LATIASFNVAAVSVCRFGFSFQVENVSRFVRIKLSTLHAALRNNLRALRLRLFLALLSGQDALT
jgi:hypothetical protein